MVDYSGELSANSSTLGRITVGGTSTSQLEINGDRDWFRISLTAGTSYEFALDGVGSGELSDPYLRLYKNGVLVAFNDDGGPGFDSLIEFTAGTSGTYYLEAAGYNDARTGEYRLSATEQAPPQEGGSILPAIDWGSRVEPRRIDVYFAKDGESFGGYSSDGWTSYEIQRALAVFAEMESMIDVRFRRTSDPDLAEFKLTIRDSASYNGLMIPPGEPNEGVAVFARSAEGWDTNGGLEQGGAGFQLMLHELGHGLGLAHPHDTGGSSGIMNGVGFPFGDYGDFNLNQSVFTVMSYNDGYRSQTGPLNVDDYGYAGTLSPLDIAMLQQRYGAQENVNAGATTYALSDTNDGGTFYSAIWDTSGQDTVTYDGARDATIDLRAATLVYQNGGGGYVSHVDGIYGGYTIAHGVVVENASGGSGDDSIRGNASANILEGGAGNDRVIGYAGDDTLKGNAGRDVISGGSGNDNIYGQADNDRLDGGTGQDRLYGGGGDDFLDVGARDGDTMQFAFGQAGDDTYLYETGSGRVFLNSLAETTTSGTDTIEFGDLEVGDLSASVFEYSNANGSAIDLSWTDGNETGFLRLANLGVNFERFVFGDNVYDTILSADGSGTAQANNADWTITSGTVDADILLGGTGRDSLYGGGGNDFLSVAGNIEGSLQFAFGQTGDDTYSYTKASGDLFISAAGETATSGTADTVKFGDLSAGDLTATVFEYTNANGMALQLGWSDGPDDGFLRLANLGENIERFEFGDDVYDTILSADGSGTAQANNADWMITRGSGAADILFGGEGRDSLYGGGGDDFLDVGGRDGDSMQFAFGQDGDDTYSYSKESGNLFINASAETATGGTDRLVFEDLLLADVTAGTVLYSNANGTVLELSWDDGTTGGFVRIADEGKNIESYEFANGQTVEYDFFA